MHQSKLCINVTLSVAASSDLQAFSGAQGSAGPIGNQTVTPVSLTQPAQVGNITVNPSLNMQGSRLYRVAELPQFIRIKINK